jgi:hypothetical protein
MEKKFISFLIIIVGFLFISVSVYSEGEKMRDIREPG